MNYVVSEAGSAPREPVYVCISESQLNALMKNLESARGRCARQSLAVHDGDRAGESVATLGRIAPSPTPIIIHTFNMSWFHR